jgi:hypothetical protein
MSSRLALVAALALVVTARAEDPPKPPADNTPPANNKPADPPKPAPGSGVLNPNPKPQMHSAGQMVARLSKVDGSTITLKLSDLEQSKNGSGGARKGKGGSQIHRVEKDHDYDLASDVKVRWKDLPKKADGKAYTDKEYNALRDPPGTPGYKADMSDLKPGQTVRLYLSKGSAKDDKVVATVVMIVADAPKGADTKDSEKPKKKKE